MVWVMNLVGIILCIPFFTLLERKVLSYSQNRKGPNKVSIMGLLQPMSDGMKLMVKTSGAPLSANYMLFYLFPLCSFMLMVCSVFFLGSFWNPLPLNLGIAAIVCLSALKMYTLLGSGWSSNSKYSLLGSLRGAAQVISYEINLMFLILFPCIFFKSYKMKMFFYSNSGIIFFFMILFLWVFSIMCETNRAPFDFAEGESELVSGFKTEYSSLMFTFLFLAEYGKIMFFSCFLSCFFLFKGWYLTSLMLIFFFLFLFLWFRTSFPRFRYDFLMIFSWCMCLPCMTLLFWSSFML